MTSRATRVVLALSLAVASGAFAGDNENATFALVGDAEVSGVGADERVSIEIGAEGLEGVKQLQVVLEVSDAAHFDLGSARLALAAGFEDYQTLVAPSKAVEGSDVQAELGGAVVGGDQVDGEAGFTVSIKTSDSFTTETEASVSVALISLGPSLEDRDEFTAEDLGLTLVINPPPPPITDPALTASTVTDVSADYSAVDSGSAADDSDGEVALGVSFADASGAAAAGQEVLFTISNAGSETVHLLTGDGGMAAAGETIRVIVATDGSGAASITLDAEGDKFAGSTSVSVSASTSAENTEGVSRDLSVDFSVTWDVPVPAELASFAGEILGEEEILLRWSAASQTNNLGWEVYRSVDDNVFERVGDLVPGAGTTDVFRSYEFVDADPPASEVVYYYLRQIDLNGAATRSGTIEVLRVGTGLGEQVVPLSNALEQNYPNPFNPGTTIRFDLAEGAFVTLRIYDGLGQVVRTLAEAALPAGSYIKLWDGRDARGLRVASGVYYYELRAGAFTSMKKMTLVQ